MAKRPESILQVDLAGIDELGDLGREVGEAEAFLQLGVALVELAGQFVERHQRVGSEQPLQSLREMANLRNR